MITLSGWSPTYKRNCTNPQARSMGEPMPDVENMDQIFDPPHQRYEELLKPVVRS